MDILEAFYRRRLKKKQKRSALFHSEVELDRAPSLASIGAPATGGDASAAGLITRVLHLTRRREPRPHSWHSTKLGEGSSESVEKVDGTSSVHSSAADLLSGLDSGGGVRWSLESLEPAQSSGRPTASHQGPRSSSCLQLSSTRSSTNDLRQSNREAAYSSHSTSLRFPERHVRSGERCFSLESVPQTEDLRSAHAHRDSREDHHSLGLMWGSSCESLRGATASKQRNEIYATTRPERPCSWSSLEHVRSQRPLRSQQRGSWHHSSSSLASAAKGLFMADGQLHTVVEKSPESSPSSRPRQVQGPGPSWPQEHQNGPLPRVAPHSYQGSSCNSTTSPPTVATPQSHAFLTPAPLPHPSQPEHPLTRLEMALAEVQGNVGGQSDTSPALGVSVLEKVSRFEHREWATRQHGPSSHRSGPKQAQVSSKSLVTLCGADDLRSTSEGGPNATKVCRTHSHKVASPDKNRSYGDDVKGAQPKMFRSTSFRCASSVSWPPPPLPPKALSYLDKADSSLLSAEKKGPKTLPKPHGVVLTPRPSAPSSSGPPAPPNQAPHGSSTLTRVCGRLRLTSEQKKRSFSEPEGMNEVGLTRSDNAALFRNAGDPTVADRRRMFERAARVVSDRAPMQEVEHAEKTCSLKREGRGQRSAQRPFSAAFQPPHTQPDSETLVSSSSLLSLTDCAQDPRPFSGVQSSALAPVGHSRFTQSLFYPGRVTSPRAPAFPPPRPDSAASPGEDDQQPASAPQSLSQEVDSPLLTEAASDNRPESTNCTSLFTPAEGAVEKDMGGESSSVDAPGGESSSVDAPGGESSSVDAPGGESSSVDAPGGESSSVDAPGGESSSVDAPGGESFSVDAPGGESSSVDAPGGESFSVAVNRAAHGTEAQDSLLPPSPVAAPDPAAAPEVLCLSVPRRERPRRSARSALAASVGLPCPLSPPGDSGQGRDERRERGASASRQQLQEPAEETQDKDCGVHEAGSKNIGPSPAAQRTPPSPAAPRTPPSPAALRTPPSPAAPRTPPSPAALRTPPSPAGLRTPLSPAALRTPPSPAALRTPLSPAALRTPPSPAAPRTEVLMEDSLMLEYEPVPTRLQSPEERRVHALVRSLVCADGSLAPLMDMWGKSTVDVLRDIFPNSPLVARLSRHHSDPLDDRILESVTESSEPDVDLITRKVELCEAFRKFNESLQREKESLSDAFNAHTELGNRVDAWVQEHCEDSERDKYHMFIGDLERVVNLLLSLCGRLARIERSLASLRRREPEEGSAELWDSLLHKQTLLLRQTQEALELRDHLERRQCTVHAFLRRSLTVAQLEDYRRLVRTTPALLISQRRLDDLLRQAQETLSLLLDTVPLEVTQAQGWSRVGLALAATPLLIMRSQAPPTWHSASSSLDHPVTVTSL